MSGEREASQGGSSGAREGMPFGFTFPERC